MPRSARIWSWPIVESNFGVSQVRFVAQPSLLALLRPDASAHPVPGIRFATRYTKGEELDHLGFAVDDVAAAYEALVARGVRAAVSPEKSTGTEVYVKDPDGIWIELLE